MLAANQRLEETERYDDLELPAMQATTPDVYGSFLVLRSLRLGHHAGSPVGGTVRHPHAASTEALGTLSKTEPALHRASRKPGSGG